MIEGTVEDVDDADDDDDDSTGRGCCSSVK